MQQLTIFDITPSSEPEPDHITEPGGQVWFDYDRPDTPDNSSILAIGDRVLILPAKYSQKANVAGVVKGFVSGEVLVRRRDGEGLYERHELHRFNGEIA